MSAKLLHCLLSVVAWTDIPSIADIRSWLFLCLSLSLHACICTHLGCGVVLSIVNNFRWYYSGDCTCSNLDCGVAHVWYLLVIISDDIILVIVHALTLVVVLCHELLIISDDIILVIVLALTLVVVLCYQLIIFCHFRWHYSGDCTCFDLGCGIVLSVGNLLSFQMTLFWWLYLLWPSLWYCVISW